MRRDRLLESRDQTVELDGHRSIADQAFPVLACGEGFDADGILGIGMRGSPTAGEGGGKRTSAATKCISRYV